MLLTLNRRALSKYERLYLKQVIGVDPDRPSRYPWLAPIVLLPLAAGLLLDHVPGEAGALIADAATVLAEALYGFMAVLYPVAYLAYEIIDRRESATAKPLLFDLVFESKNTEVWRRTAYLCFFALVLAAAAGGRIWLVGIIGLSQASHWGVRVLASRKVRVILETVSSDIVSSCKIND